MGGGFFRWGQGAGAFCVSATASFAASQASALAAVYFLWRSRSQAAHSEVGETPSASSTVLRRNLTMADTLAITMRMIATTVITAKAEMLSTTPNPGEPLGCGMALSSVSKSGAAVYLVPSEAPHSAKSQDVHDSARVARSPGPSAAGTSVSPTRT